MALETYREKRDFAVTPEPRGRRKRPRAGSSFVIQKHDATRLHYDLRLELDGVLKSWAVTKGPSLVPGEKRLAVHVEDHPLDYGDFEGTIPKGEYGGGTVIVWDRGTWTPVGDAHRGLTKGHLEFELHGAKLNGRWHLVRMRGKPREKRENWLLIKGDDEFARAEGDADILDERPESVKSGKDIADVSEEARAPASGQRRKPAKTRRTTQAARKSAAAGAGDGHPATVEGAKPASMPRFVEPMLATLRTAPPTGDEWLHEIKFDGYRLQAHIRDGRVTLLTRSARDWTTKFGKTVMDALAGLPVREAIIDGELVVEGGSGASDFSALQADLADGRTDRFVYYGFDLLHLDGCDLTRAPLTDRKTRLREIVGEDGRGPVRYSGHFVERGALVLRHACRLSLEGIVSKRADSLYRPGRGRNWIKSKCSARQEFVVAGYLPSSVTPRAIGSLVLGVYDGGRLHHVGRVGTGFTGAVAADLFRRLQGLRVASSAFGGKLTAEQGRGVVHVRPELVAEVEFRAWTADGHLRHASFRGLREDKVARAVTREDKGAGSTDTTMPPRTVKLTHPDRIYWPDVGVTKEGLADYYSAVWRHVALHVVGRPLALLRCPNGVGGETFFQKHPWPGINPHIALVQDPKKRGEQPLISIDDLDGLMALVQSAALEIHPWGSTIADWERPDRIVMDLDPGEEVPWQSVIDAAREVRARLEGAGLAAFVKTSGGKGLHVVAPLTPKADWPVVKAFTKGMAEAMAADHPDLYVATIAKSARKGRILIDYLRNQRGATAVAAYSPRARAGAPVSTPLAWDELGPDLGPANFTIDTLPARLEALAADPWSDFRQAAVPLETGKPRSKRIR